MTRLIARTVLELPMSHCFDLVRDVGVHCATSTAIAAEAVGGRLSGLAGPGDQTRWSARFFGLSWELTMQITQFEPPVFFTEEMVEGPFRVFLHCYRFRSLGGRETLFEDDFRFESPCSVLGRTMDFLVLRQRLALAQAARMEGLRIIAARGWKA